MKRQNRYYPPEFKQEALGLLATGEYNMAQLERELGITSGLLRQWKRKAERKGEYVSPNGLPTTPEAAEARIRRGFDVLLIAAIKSRIEAQRIRHSQPMRRPLNGEHGRRRS